MVVRFVCVFRVLVCARVSRLPPVSFYRYWYICFVKIFSSMPTAARAPSLAAESFLGRFTRALDEYDAMPTLRDIDDGLACAADDVDENFDESQHPRLSLAQLAEQTRSQLLAKRVQASAVGMEQCHECNPTPDSKIRSSQKRRASTPRTPPASTIASPRTIGIPKKKSSSFALAHPPASKGVLKTSNSDASLTTDRATPAVKQLAPPVVSMITHASRLTPRTCGPGHTFGALPRVSPSGTMAHHVPPSSAPPRPTSTRAASRTPVEEPPTRPTSARSKAGASVTTRAASRAPSDPSTDARPLPVFGADAKGAIAYRSPTAPSTKRRPPFSFACIECCGEEFDGFCCRRHHPDDAVVCCDRHDPLKQKAMAKSAMGGRVGAGKGPAFSMGMPKGPRVCVLVPVPVPGAARSSHGDGRLSERLAR